MNTTAATTTSQPIVFMGFCEVCGGISYGWHIAEGAWNPCTCHWDEFGCGCVVNRSDPNDTGCMCDDDDYEPMTDEEIDAACEARRAAHERGECDEFCWECVVMGTPAGQPVTE